LTQDGALPSQREVVNALSLRAGRITTQSNGSRAGE
jgi:hypothetical protein